MFEKETSAGTEHPYDGADAAVEYNGNEALNGEDIGDEQHFDGADAGVEFNGNESDNGEDGDDDGDYDGICDGDNVGVAYVGNGNTSEKREKREADTTDGNTSEYPNLSSYFTTDELFDSKEDVRQWCIHRGVSVNCVVVIKRSKTKKIQDNEKGSSLILACERSGKYVDHKAKDYVRKTEKKRRRTGSRKCGCPFELRAHCEENGKWVLKVKNGLHNHSLPVVLTGHPYVARLKDNELKTVETMTNSGVRPRNILSALKIDNPDSKSTIRNVYNAKLKLKLLQTEERRINE